MAIYTLLFKDYKDAGGLLPASFTQLNELFDNVGLDFAGAFDARFAFREIGAETLSQFENMLDAKARLIYPQIKSDLDAQSKAVDGRKRTETTTQDLTNTAVKGGIKSVTRNLAHAPITTPLNDADVVDGASQSTDFDDDVNTSTGTIIREYDESSIDDSIRYAELQERFKYVFQDALRAFDGCFLGVW